MIGRLFRYVRHVWRSSVTGRFVKRDYAEAHPETTEEQRIVMRDEGDL
jgi:hypothetical protein